MLHKFHLFKCFIMNTLNAMGKMNLHVPVSQFQQLNILPYWFLLSFLSPPFSCFETNPRNLISPLNTSQLVHLSNNTIKDIFLHDANVRPKKINNNSFLSSKISIEFPSLSELFAVKSESEHGGYKSLLERVTTCCLFKPGHI